MSNTEYPIVDLWLHACLMNKMMHQGKIQDMIPQDEGRRCLENKNPHSDMANFARSLTCVLSILG